MAIKKAFFTSVLVLTTVLLALSGCASSSSSTSSSGIKADKGVDLTTKTINLGILSPFSGPVAAPIGDPLARGVEVFFKSVNDHGGIDGFKVNLTEKASQYNPHLAIHMSTHIPNQP